FVFFGTINDREKIAADSIGDWLHQPKCRVRGDGGVDRAAAAFQNVEADLRSGRYARANHCVPRENFRSRREILPRDSIDLCGSTRQTPRTQEGQKEPESFLHMRAYHARLPAKIRSTITLRL